MKYIGKIIKAVRRRPYAVCYAAFGVMMYGSVGACETDLISLEKFLQREIFCVFGILATMLIQISHKKIAAKKAAEVIEK